MLSIHTKFDGKTYEGFVRCTNDSDHSYLWDEWCNIWRLSKEDAIKDAEKLLKRIQEKNTLESDQV